MPQGFILEEIEGKLSLRNIKRPEFNPLFIDFLSAEMQRKKQNASTSKDLLIKAIGAVKERPKILDCTLGLGTDSFLMSVRGCEVWACERNSVVCELWKDAAQRAKIESILLQEMDAFNFLQQTQEIFETIYLDPMYPEKNRKSAQKKEMVLLSELLSCEKLLDDAALFSLALEKAKKRVVVKRPLHGELLVSDKEPTIQFKGKAVRFDVYLKI